MRKLLFLSVLALGSAQAVQSAHNVSVVAPTGAQSLLIYSGTDKSDVYTVPADPNPLSLRIVVSDNGIRYALRVTSRGNRFRSESTSSNDIKMVPPFQFASAKQISPRLNEWVTLVKGQQETGFNLSLGGLKSQRQPLSVAMLFSSKSVEKVSDKTKPPQKP